MTLQLISCHAAPPLSSNEAIAIPLTQGYPVVVADGHLDSREWQCALEILLARSHMVRLSASADAFYLAILASPFEPRYVDVYFARDNGEILNLHASLQTGQRIITSPNWTDDTPPWSWQASPDWHANAQRLKGELHDDQAFADQIIAMDAYEFVIRRSLIGEPPWKVFVEVKDFVGVADHMLLPPAGSVLNPATWLEVSVGTGLSLPGAPEENSGDAVRCQFYR